MKTNLLSRFRLALQRAWVVWMVAAPLMARAHDPGLSSVNVLLRDGGDGVVRLLIHPADLDRLRRLAPKPLDATAGMTVRVDGRAMELRLVSTERVDEGELAMTWSFPAPGSGAVEIHSAMLELLPRGHRQMLSVSRDEGAARFVSLLDAAHPSARVAIIEGSAPRAKEPASVSPGAGGFVLLGIEHILTGFDHLIFLLGLLAAGGGVRTLVRIVTGFTVGHSVTLTLGALELVRLPGTVVEPLIAASLVYVGLENLLRQDPGRGRPGIAALFGLIHGLGFSSALREAGVEATGLGMAGPLLGFNLGVEIGQIAVVAAVVPGLVWLARRPEVGLRWARGCSLVVTAAGSWWLATRLWGMG